MPAHGSRRARAGAGVGVAHGVRLDDVANLLEHLAQVLRGGGPGEVAHDDLQAGGRLGAAGVDAAGLVGAARALEAHDDGAALELGVVQLRDRRRRRLGGLVVDEAPALGAAAGLARNLGLDHGANLRAVRCVVKERMGKGERKENVSPSSIAHGSVRYQ